MSAEEGAQPRGWSVKNVVSGFFPTHLIPLPFSVFLSVHSDIVCLQCMLGGFEGRGQGASGSAAESGGMSLLLPGPD